MFIFFEKDCRKKNPLERNPYLTFNQKYDECVKEDLFNSRIEIPNLKDGFDEKSTFALSFGMAFSFFKVMNNCLICHTFKIKFDEDEIRYYQTTMEEIAKRKEYFYISGDYMEFTYVLHAGHVEIIVYVLTSQDVNTIREACNQLISHDIAIWARGW